MISVKKEHCCSYPTSSFRFLYYCFSLHLRESPNEMITIQIVLFWYLIQWFLPNQAFTMWISGSYFIRSSTLSAPSFEHISGWCFGGGNMYFAYSTYQCGDPCQMQTCLGLQSRVTLGHPFSSLWSLILFLYIGLCVFIIYTN